MGVPLFMALDICWLKFYFGKPYFKMIKEIQHTELKMRYSMGSVAYASMLLGLMVITIPNIDATTNSSLITSCLQYGTSLGAAIYGTYAFTCASIYINFKTSIAIQDTLWVSFLYTVVPMTVFAFFRIFESK